MSTVALQMIIKDELDAVIDIVEQAHPYFDEINLTVTDPNVADELEKQAKFYKIVNVEQRDWNNRFDEARNDNLKMCNSDYYFWIDADDEFDFSQIPKLVRIAEEGGYDQILLPYNYAQNEQGETVAYHWRERLISTKHPFVWKGWVHETPVTDLPFTSKRVDVPVTHHNSPEHVQESLARNHTILEQAVRQSDDPRYKLYLGQSYHALKQYEKAIEILDKYLAESGSAEDSYRAICVMSECAYHMGAMQPAINYALKAAGLIPEYPQAYWLLGQWENEQENWAEGLEWLKVSETKPDPDTIAVVDPTSRDRARLMAAQAEFMQRNYSSALAWLNKVSDTNESKPEIIDMFRNEAEAEVFVKLLPTMRRFFKSDKALWEALAYDLQYDNRLKGLRDLVNEPKTWDDRSIVILCGQGYEEWGPHTLNKGMGGSEEAVVYLSRELARLGWVVTVYGAVDEKLDDRNNGFVTYLPWKEFDRRDEFNVFVAWRAPEFAEGIKAKVKLADIHDIIPKQSVKPYPDVTYMFKSEYHKSLYPHLSDDMSRVIGNGIKKDQFKKED